MHIVSLEGPGLDSGTSAALTTAWSRGGTADTLWWHLADASVQVTSDPSRAAAAMTTLSKDLVAGHYHYCNSFLYPILHDVPQYATYRAEDHQSYVKLNSIIAWYIAEANAVGSRGDAFIQDYQFALVPQRLRETSNLRSALFWHVPWPKQVFEPHRDPLRELARALLHTKVLGFPTEEYARNFLEFVDKELPAFNSNLDDMSVWTSEHDASTRYLTSEAAIRFRGMSLTTSNRRVTRVVVKPLPIDIARWEALAHASKNSPSLLPLPAASPYILSVDHPAYTTGLSERLEAIDLFFEQHPQWRGKVVFASVCERTRTGIGAFDGYYRSCEQHRERIQEKWSIAESDWKPLAWIEQPMSDADLASLYAGADGMLLNGVRDGLNLHAKEFVAAQVRLPGVLMLSPTVGAWQELQGGALEARADAPVESAQAINDALYMSFPERTSRMAVMQAALSMTEPWHWWQAFTGELRRAGRKTSAA